MLRATSSHLFRDSASGPDPSFNTTMGMMLIGLIADTMTLDTLQLALLCHATYYFLILCYGDPDALAVSVW